LPASWVPDILWTYGGELISKACSSHGDLWRGNGDAHILHFELASISTRKVSQNIPSQTSLTCLSPFAKGDVLSLLFKAVHAKSGLLIDFRR